jgi:hypothetical protein
MRIFTAHEHVCEYVPTTPDMVAKSEEAIAYINWVFMEDNPGFLNIYGVFKDALIKSEGIIKWWTEQNEVRRTQQYAGITEEQFKYLLSEVAADPKKYQMTRHENFLGNGPDGPAKLYNCIIVCTHKENVHRVKAIPPEEFRIDRLATSVGEAGLVGHERVVTVSDLVELGLDEELVEEHAGSDLFVDTWSAEKAMRNEGLELGTNTFDHTDGVLYGEYFIRIDKDEDGIAELRKICVVGDTCEIVYDEEPNSRNSPTSAPTRSRIRPSATASSNWSWTSRRSRPTCSGRVWTASPTPSSRATWSSRTWSTWTTSSTRKSALPSAPATSTR